jgi:opacity protein-like surface antigen
MRTYGTLLAGILVLLLVCPAAYSQDKGVAHESSFFQGWTFDVAPFYLWIPALDGTVTVRGLSADVDLSVGDTLDLLFDSFKFAATGRAEARKGNVLLTLGLMYMNLEENTQTDIGLGVTTEFKQLILEFGGGYHLLDWSLPGEGFPTLAVDFLAGGRFVHLDSGLTIENFADVDRSQDWLDPFLGARLKLDIIDRVSVSVRGDIGGFGVGSHFTWNMAALVAYQASQRITLGAGYRILDINFSEGTGSNKFKYDVQMRGPMLGFAIHF